MAKAIVSIGEVQAFKNKAKGFAAGADTLSNSLRGQFKSWQDGISAERNKGAVLCQNINAKLGELSQRAELLREKVDECAARLSTIDMYKEETEYDEDGNEHTVLVENPEYAAVEAELQALNAELSDACKKIDALEQLRGEAEGDIGRLDSAQSSIDGSLSALDNINVSISNFVERAVGLIDGIIEDITEYASVSINAAGAGSGANASSFGGATGANASKRGTDGAENKPRSLVKTAQTWTRTPDGLMYDSPFETGRQLLSNQGAVIGYGSTCGVVSCANIARLAGVQMTEEKALETALNNNLCEFQKRTFWTRRSIDGGGTTAEDRQKLLKHFGIDSRLESASVDAIATRVSEGRGVIVSVRAGTLWGMKEKGLHAITVTSVLRNPDGSLYGFYVCDSGTGGVDASKFYTASEIGCALTPNRYMNVTTNIIR